MRWLYGGPIILFSGGLRGLYNTSSGCTGAARETVFISSKRLIPWDGVARAAAFDTNGP